MAPEGHSPKLPVEPAPDDDGLLTLVDLGGFVAGAVVAVGAVLYGWLSAPSTWSLSEKVASPLLIGFAIGLAFAWYHVGNKEGRMLNAIGAGVLPEMPWYSTGLLALSGALFVALFPAALAPPVFGVVLLAIKLVESLNAYIAGSRIDPGIEQAFASEALPPEQEKRGVSLARWQAEAPVLDHYYFGHPWYQLACGRGRGHRGSQHARGRGGSGRPRGPAPLRAGRRHQHYPLGAELSPVSVPRPRARSHARSSTTDATDTSA